MRPCTRCGGAIEGADGLPMPILCPRCFGVSFDALKQSGLLDKTRQPSDSDRYHWWCLEQNRQHVNRLLEVT